MDLSIPQPNIKFINDRAILLEKFQLNPSKCWPADANNRSPPYYGSAQDSFSLEIDDIDGILRL